MTLSPPYQPNSETSRAAAEKVAGKTPTARARVFATLAAERGGLTDEEMQDLLRMNANTQRPRRRELVQLGLVRDSGRVRPTRSGDGATVWEVAPPELQLELEGMK